MNIKLYFTFCILIIFFVSCIDNKTNNKLAKDDLYDINLDASSSEDALFDKKLLLSDIADSIIYVPLQLTDSTIIGKVSELFLTEDRIFVFDRNLAKSLFAYSRKGDLLFQKSRGIGGPHEIYDLQDVSIDKINKIIAIYSAGYNKVFLYDYNGKLQKEIKFLEGFSDVEIIDAAHYLCYREFQPEGINPKDSYSNYRLCYLDGEGKLLKGWYKNVRNKNIQLPTNSNFFAKRYNNTILFEGSNKDSIFSFSSRQEEVLPFMTSNLKSSKVLLTSKSYNEYNKLSANIANLTNVPIESENFILGSYAYKTIVYSYLFNKSLVHVARQILPQIPAG